MRKKIFSINKGELGISYFSGTGSGGQHRNRHMNCVRMFHKASGAKVSCQDFREKRRNEVEALRRLSEHRLFRLYVMRRCAVIEMDYSKICKEVDREMRPENLLVETFTP